MAEANLARARNRQRGDHRTDGQLLGLLDADSSPICHWQRAIANLPQAVRRRLSNATKTCARSANPAPPANRSSRRLRSSKPTASPASIASSTAKPANHRNSAPDRPRIQWNMDPGRKHGPRHPAQSDNQRLHSRLAARRRGGGEARGGEPLHNYPFKFPVCG